MKKKISKIKPVTSISQTKPCPPSARINISSRNQAAHAKDATTGTIDKEPAIDGK